MPGDYDGNGTTDIAVYRRARRGVVRPGPAALLAAVGPGERRPRARRLRRQRHDRHRHLPTRRAVYEWSIQRPYLQIWGTSCDIPQPLPYALFAAAPGTVGAS